MGYENHKAVITPLDEYKSWASESDRKLDQLEHYRRHVASRRDDAQSELDQIDAAIAALKRFYIAENA